MATITLSDTDNLQEAIEDATAGDTLNLHAGTYTSPGNANTEIVNQESVFYLNKTLTIQGFANEARPVLTYDPLDVPHLAPSNGYGHILFVGSPGFPDAPNVVLRHLEVVGMNALEIPSGENGYIGGYCIQFRPTTGLFAGSIIEDCIARDHTFGIGMDANGGIIRYCEVHHCGAAHPDSRFHGMYLDAASPDGITVAYNYLHHNSGYGLHCYSAPVNYKIYGNVSVHNSYGLLLTGEGHTVVNNVFAFNDGGGITPNDSSRSNVTGYASDTTFENNLMWGDGLQGHDLNWDATQSSCTFRNNCYGGVVDSFHASDLRIDPKFLVASPDGFADFRLRGNSPVGRAGLAQSAPYNVLFSQLMTEFGADTLTLGAYTPIGAFTYGGVISRG